MKKNVIAIVLAVLICLPCLLILDGGPNATNGEETLQLTNVFGLVWFAFLVFGGFKLITPKWIRDEFKAYIEEEDE